MENIENCRDWIYIISRMLGITQHPDNLNYYIN